MADSNGGLSSQPGPFEKFLQQCTAYRAFLMESGPEPVGGANSEAIDSVPAEHPQGKLCADLMVARARFVITLDLANRLHPSATLTFPSRASRLELDDLHDCVRRVIGAVYPERRLTLQVALIRDGSETRLDLASYWDGALYERALADSSLTAVVYYVEIPNPFPRVPTLISGSSGPDLMYGFVPAYEESREFITVSSSQAQYIGVDLVSALLARHREYADADPLADAEALVQQIRAFSKAHAPQPLL